MSLFVFLLPFLQSCRSVQMTFGGVCWGMKLQLLGAMCSLGRCLWFGRLPSQDKDDGDEEEKRASAETSDQT